MSKKFAWITFSLIILITILSIINPQIPENFSTDTINGADTAWMLTCTALVLIMTPGLAFFTEAW